MGGAICSVSDAIDAAAEWTFGTPRGALKLGACDNPTPPPGPTGPFDGGQCSGVLYSVSYQGFIDGALKTTSTVERFGAIVPFGPRQNGGRTEAGFQFNVPNSPQDFVVVSTNDDAEVRVDYLSVSRVDGLADDCGSPDPNPPEMPGPQPISFSYTNNEGDNVDVSGDVNISAPILIAPFVLVAPISVNLGGITFDGSVELSPNFNITLSPSFGGGGQQPEPISPVPESDQDPDSDSDDTPPESTDTPIRGLSVTLNYSPDMRATEVRQDGDIGSLAVPRAGILYFIATANNRDVWMPGIDLKSRSQYIPVPYNAIVYRWRIHTEPGISVASARPIFDVPT